MHNNKKSKACSNWISFLINKLLILLKCMILLILQILSLMFLLFPFKIFLKKFLKSLLFLKGLNQRLLKSKDRLQNLQKLQNFKNLQEQNLVNHEDNQLKREVINLYNLLKERRADLRRKRRKLKKVKND